MQLSRFLTANLFGIALLGSTATLLTSIAPIAATAQATSTGSATGQELLRQGNFTAAKIALQQELKQAEVTGNIALQQAILLNASTVECRLGQGATAQELLDQVKNLGPLSPSMAAQHSLGQAQLLLMGGKFPEAEALLAEARPALTMPNEILQYEVLLGSLHRNIGRYADALATAESALALDGDIVDRARALQLRADVNWDLRQMQAAEKDYRQALVGYRSIKDSIGQSRILQRLGWIYQEMSRWEDSEMAYTQALNQSLAIKDVQGQMSARLQLGQIALKQGQLDKAQRILTMAIAQSQPNPVLARMHLLKGQTHVQAGEFDLALAEYANVDDPARPLGNAMTNIMLQRQRGEVYLLQKKLEQAETEFRGAIASFENLRHGLWDQQKVTLFDAHVTLYDRLQETLIAQDRVEEALVVSEQSRARAFNELLAQRLVKNHSDHAVVDGHKHHAAISAPPNLEKIRAIARAENATLLQYAVIQPLTQNYIEASNAPNVEAPERLLTWVVRPSGEITFHQQNLDNLDGSLAQWVATQRGQISSRGNTRGGFAFNAAQAQLIASRLPEPEQAETRNYKALQELHRVLIEPIAGALPANPEETVVIVPHKALLMVPFPALQDQQRKFLVEQHTPRIITSIQALALTEKKKQVAESTRQAATEAVTALVVGNPIMPRLSAVPGRTPQQLAPLPGSEFEAQQISPLLQTQPLIGEVAYEGKVSQEMLTAPILHFATHGLFDEQHGLNSSLALTAQGGDGFLTAEEIMDLKLRADLAVLSACDTARGAITGDGVVGLSRAFFAAGVPSVLSSLWPVADFSTAELMEEFYVNLQDEPDKGQALRQAMLSTMEEYPDPADWGAFVLMGQS